MGDRPLHRPLDYQLVQVVPADPAGGIQHREPSRGEYPLPPQGSVGRRSLPRQRPRQEYPPRAPRQVPGSSTRASCAARLVLASSDTIVTRSLPPLPRRTLSSLMLKSTSFTRSWSASSSRTPLPYSSWQTSSGVPSRRAMIAATWPG